MARFCMKCGKELKEREVFCTSCGAKVDSPQQEAKTAAGDNAFNRVWNGDLLTETAIRFSYLWEWVSIPVNLWISQFLFNEVGGLWGKVFGFLFLAAAPVAVYSIIKRAKKKKDFFRASPNCPVCGKKSTNARFCSNCGSAMPQMSAKDLLNPDDLTPESLKEKKRDLFLKPAIILAVILFLRSGIWDEFIGGPVAEVKRVTLGSYSSTIGEMVSSHLEGAKWSKDKLAPGKYEVTVKGFIPDIDESIRMKFIYKEKDDDYYETSLKSIQLLDSGETYKDLISMGVILEYLDGGNETEIEEGE